MSSIKICLISSHGGHLRELLNAANEVKGEKYYVTCKTRHTEELLRENKHYFVIDPHKSIFKYLMNTMQSLKHVIKEKPDLVISTGAGIAIPTILLCKYLFKAKIIFIESAANVVNPSRTGKMLYRYADLFLIQWPSMQQYYPKAMFCGLV
jgi:beta-1,4-N-acetylglucosaminyltransferase